MTKKNKADLALLFVTMGWGASFILSKAVLGELQVLNFLAIRFIIAFVIASVIFIKPMSNMSRDTLKYGIGLGVVLFLGFSIQTFGLLYTTVSKSAFITGLNVIMVPILLAGIQRRLPKPKIFLGALIAVTGLGLLTLTGGQMTVNIGDGLTLLSALFFAIHIVGVGSAPKAVQAVPMGILQIGTVGVLSLLLSVATETPKLPVLPETWVNIILLAVVCTAGAYIVQNVAQQHTTATQTALIYTMEPVFAAICGFLMLGEVLSISAMFGAVLIISGTLVNELSFNLNFLTKKSASPAPDIEA